MALGGKELRDVWFPWFQAQSFFVYPVQATKIATVSDMTDIASIEYFSKAAFDTTAVVRAERWGKSVERGWRFWDSNLSRCLSCDGLWRRTR
jgi:hypothetical protein